jgi:CDP-6-deoxy-D-xylo-4-hexulose-3-dehydrase
MNVEQIKELIPVADMLWVTHLAGMPTNMYDIIDFANDTNPNLIIAEDCCQSYGATCDSSNNDNFTKAIKRKIGRKIGTFGIASTFSFYYGHHMTTIEGGMLVIDVETEIGKKLYSIAQSIRGHGLARVVSDSNYREKLIANSPDIDSRFLFSHMPFNMRNTEISAVLGREQLKRLDNFITERNNNWKKFSYIYMPEIANLATPIMQVPGTTLSSFCLPFVFNTKELRDAFVCEAENYGFETRPLAGGVLIDQPAFKFIHGSMTRGEVGMPTFDFSKSRDLYQRSVYIGNNHMIEEVDWINLSNLLNKFGETYS